MEKEKILKLTKATDKYLNLDFKLYNAKEVSPWDISKVMAHDELFRDGDDSLTIDGYPDLADTDDGEPYVTVELDTKDILKPKVILTFNDIHDRNANLIEGTLVYEPDPSTIDKYGMMELMDNMTLIDELPVGPDSIEGDIINLEPSAEFNADWRIKEIKYRGGY